MSEELRAWLLATLGGWLVALVLVYLGERGLQPPPPAAALLRVPPGEQPRSLAPRPADAVHPDGALLATVAPTTPAEVAEPTPPPRLVVVDPVGANLRAEPAMASPVLATLPHGAQVEAEPEDADAEARGPGWRHVAWNGRAGWVAEGLLQPVTEGP
ncbi:MAG TPA: SH3 domain-containing protein [Chloroflexota bacterium]|nr:SH3 domain-containing protein [Chloroflexota bacterium]